MIIDNNIDLQLTTHLSLMSVPFFTITFKLKGNTKRSVNTRYILTVNWDNKLFLTSHIIWKCGALISNIYCGHQRQCCNNFN